MEANTDESQEAFSNKNCNAKIMGARDTILDAAPEDSIDENWCLLNNQ